MSWLKSVRARAYLLFGRRAAELRMEDEMRFHLEMEAERLMREKGLGAAEARRRACLAFGGQDRYREAMRDGRGLAWLSGLRLDLKLGIRMLFKYPVLTAASVLALSFAVALAASWFEFMSDLAFPRIPLEGAESLVEVESHDLEKGVDELRSLHDFEMWRTELRSIEDLSAVSPVSYNLTTEDGRFPTLHGARVTPSIFRLTRARPVAGRVLADADARPGAAPVAVLGHAAWQRLFDGDRTIIGRSIRLGSDSATVVGVMPPDFGFPVNQEIWTPLRESAASYKRRAGPPLEMFGRLAPGLSLAEAQAELDVIGQRTAAAFPDTHKQLRPAVQRFAHGNDMAGVAALINLPFLLFLAIVSANVGTLLFARTATRASEIAMRRALGASRKRVILQLVAEALVLTSAAAALGLAAAQWGLGWGMDLFWEVQQMRPPFWFDSSLSAPTVIYVCALAVLGAIIIGTLPGLRATRRDLRELIGQPRASETKFGLIATGVIVVQVALCVAFIPVAIMNGQDLLPKRGETDFPAETYLSGRLTRQLDPAAMSATPQPDAHRTADLFDEVYRRLTAQPGVLAVTRADRMPGFNHPARAVQLDEEASEIRNARAIAIAPNFFDVMDARIVSGRAFSEGDDTSAVRVAIVDEKWAQKAFGGRNPIGRRLRYGDATGERPGPWYEVVGVVAGMERAIGPGTQVALFHPLGREVGGSVQIYVRTAGHASAFVARLQNLAAVVDPGLGFAALEPLADTWRPVLRSDAFFASALAVISAVFVLFALIGTYALMSFTVAQRTREIGIRAALGANPRRIILAIFSRGLMQIGSGIVIGATLVSLAAARSPGGFRIVVGVALGMIVVGLLGCALPAARALRIQPTEALRSE